MIDYIIFLVSIGLLNLIIHSAKTHWEEWEEEVGGLGELWEG